MSMKATRFFWAWLVVATCASVAGNVAHAVLSGPPSPVIAAAAAVVPPAVLCGALHGVTVLARATVTGWAYRAAMAMTCALAGCAFVLSFGALRDLAIRWAGYPPEVAWLWPLAIDLSVALSTVALLALTRPAAPVRKTRPRTAGKRDKVLPVPVSAAELAAVRQTAAKQGRRAPVVAREAILERVDPAA